MQVCVRGMSVWSGISIYVSCATQSLTISFPHYIMKWKKRCFTLYFHFDLLQVKEDERKKSMNRSNVRVCRPVCLCFDEWTVHPQQKTSVRTVCSLITGVMFSLYVGGTAAGLYCSTHAHAFVLWRFLHWKKTQKWWFKRNRRTLASTETSKGGKAAQSRASIYVKSQCKTDYWQTALK